MISTFLWSTLMYCKHMVTNNVSVFMLAKCIDQAINEHFSTQMPPYYTCKKTKNNTLSYSQPQTTNVKSRTMLFRSFSLSFLLPAIMIKYYYYYYYYYYQTFGLEEKEKNGSYFSLGCHPSKVALL